MCTTQVNIHAMAHYIFGMMVVLVIRILANIYMSTCNSTTTYLLALHQSYVLLLLVRWFTSIRLVSCLWHSIHHCVRAIQIRCYLIVFFHHVPNCRNIYIVIYWHVIWATWKSKKQRIRHHRTRWTILEYVEALTNLLLLSIQVVSEKVSFFRQQNMSGINVKEHTSYHTSDRPLCQYSTRIWAPNSSRKPYVKE